MIKKIINKGLDHFSLGIIVLGAGSFFLSNILLKEILTDQDYGKYSIVITFFSVIFIYGLLGLEQIFIRYSNFLRNDTIETQRFQVKLVTRVILFTSAVGALFFAIYYKGQIELNPVMLYLSSISMVAMLYLFNIFRLNSNFILAQFVSNFWKIILLVLSGVFFLAKQTSLELLLNILMLGIILTFIGSLYYCYKKIHFVYNESHTAKEILMMGFYFFISISSFSLLMFGDRFIIESKFGLKEFGNYFYLTNFFLAPFSILQNYVGFRQLVFFKKHFSLQAFDAFNRKILMVGVGLALVLFAIPQVMARLDIVKFDFSHYTLATILLLVLGIIRLYSSAINSAFEAKTNIDSLQKANVIFIIVSLVIIIFTLLFFNSLEMIIATIVVIWIIRIAVYKSILMKQIARHDNLISTPTKDE